MLHQVLNQPMPALTHQRYTDGAGKQLKGLVNTLIQRIPRGVLGATKTDKDADAYNERTKAEYHDLSNLKTKPSYPEGTVEKGGDLETVKNLAYEEGKRKANWTVIMVHLELQINHLRISVQILTQSKKKKSIKKTNQLIIQVVFLLCLRKTRLVRKLPSQMLNQALR